MNTQYQGQRSRAEKVQCFKTPRGIDVWLVEDYTIPLVALECAFRGGATQDPEDKAGTVSLLASVLDEGAGPYQAEDFHKALEERAIELSFSTDADALRARLKTLVRHVDEAFDFLKLSLQEPLLELSAIDRMRAETLAKLKEDLHDPEVQAGRLWARLAFPHHPYGVPSCGTLETIPFITREDLVDVHRKLIAREHLKIAIVGAISQDKAASLVDHAFQNLPSHAALRPVSFCEVSHLGTKETIDIDVPQSSIRFGFSGLARKDKDYMAAVVINHILGGGVFSARLFREVREKRGLAYSVYTQLSTWDHAHALTGGTATKNERVPEALEVIEKEISDLAHRGPSEEELEKAKKFLIGSYDLSLDTSTKIAHRLVYLQTEDFPVTYLDARNHELAAVTWDHACQVAKRLLEDQKLLIALAGRPKWETM